MRFVAGVGASDATIELFLRYGLPSSKVTYHGAKSQRQCFGHHKENTAGDKINECRLAHLDSSVVLVAPIETRLIKCHVLGPCLGPIFVVLATHDVMAGIGIGIGIAGSQHHSPYAVLQATVDIVRSDEMMAMGMRSCLPIVQVAG